MSVRVRLTRVGSKKNPIWRVVVADQRSPRDGRFIEAIGHYNPQTNPSTITIDDERLQHWLARGAQPTGTVKQLVKAHAKGISADPKTSPAPPPAQPVAVEEPPAEPEAADEATIEPPGEGTPPREAADAAADAPVADDVPDEPASADAADVVDAPDQADASEQPDESEQPDRPDADAG